jgi:hypothetical protein
MPAVLAFLPGFFAGSMCFGVIIHWITLFLSGWRRNPIDAPLPTTGRILARIFTVLHPAPWLVFFGIPYAFFRLVTQPPAAGWRWFFAGMAAALLVMLFPVALFVIRSRKRVVVAPIEPTTRGDNVA